jgi:hypothetical protein
LDISINDITVNGVSISGASFPNYPGDGLFGTTTQIGTYDVVIYYGLGVPGQSIALYDSLGDYYCNATVGTGGGKIMTFSGVYINDVTALSFTAQEGTC